MSPKVVAGKSVPYKATDSMKTPVRSILSSRVRGNAASLNKVKFHLNSPDNSRFSDSTRTYFGDENVKPNPRPLLGYDWIAGVVEMDSLPTSSGRGVELTQGFLNEIDEFRKTNREECTKEKGSQDNENYLTPIKPRRMYPSSPDPSDTKDVRIIDYTVNSRLYPVPIDNTTRVKPGTTTSPRFIRISVPKSVLTTPNKFKRGVSKLSDTDSMAIQDHCEKGCQYSLPLANRIPKPRSTSDLDLKSSLLPDPTRRVRDVGALHSTILTLPPALSHSKMEVRRYIM